MTPDGPRSPWAPPPDDAARPASYVGGWGWFDEPPPPSNRGLLIGLGAGGAVLVLLVGAAVALVVAEEQGRPVLTLAAGDCFDDPATLSDEVESVPVVDCAVPHDNEVIHVFDLPEAPSAPDPLHEDAFLTCLDAFAGYVGTSYEESELELDVFWPTEESWQAGDREAVCYVYDLDWEPLTGTVRHTGR